MYFEGCDTTSGFFMPVGAAHIRAYLDEEKVRYVFLPGNIDTNRMICLVIALYAKKIHVYERMKSNKITKMMVGLANGQGAKGRIATAAESLCDDSSSRVPPVRLQRTWHLRASRGYAGGCYSQC
ncbi:hypothetical protein JG687_00017657 [Phytophthora cactorum]|uniref:Uncharacterized protein n=1 Tax=Phytophthora cactorum TaxID=29920 RepID=A0A8T1TMS3_9STRA|nr:hypothetical protein JG687_00017657 [Phytophthora cactorum]